MEVTPHATNHAPVDDWIADLVKKLKPYELSKAEVLNLINMGIGVRVPSQQNQEEIDGEAEDEEEQPDEEAEMSRDVQFFKVAVEEAEERFPGEDGEERIKEMVSILKHTIKSKQGQETEVQANGVDDVDG